MNIKQLPSFKYHPDPIASGVFVKSDSVCPVCNQNNGYKYVGPFYAFTEVENICPWCIKNGKAAEKYDLTFVDEDEIDSVADEQAIEELTKMTPGYFFPQGDTWPAHCDDFCILLGGAKVVEIEDKLSLLTKDLEFIKERLEITDDMLLKDLTKDNSPLWWILFKCKGCDSYKLIADYE
ncbi:CbrC family protein [Vibrio spartinae]|uniref:CreB-regulated gene C protein n=1 Tax=Vibrio spartinae TaxID=1918945 RepID=A0ABX6QZD8_9VIBR|nr:CbrC family protein [Vibrio spartinae]QMV14628.1 CreB-regulated gene C protein [Vibrio spartinae]